MKDILKKQTQQFIFDRLKGASKEDLNKIKDKQIWGLVNFLYSADMTLQARSVLGVTVSKNEYYFWIKEVINILKK